MGLFKFFKKQEDNKFVAVTEFDAKRASRKQADTQGIAQLRKFNVSEEKELKLEYFFYTNTAEKAQGLGSALGQLNYSVRFGPSASNPSIFVITGWTNKIKMTDEHVINWGQQMCELGLKFDCDFDGWGTDPTGGQ